MTEQHIEAALTTTIKGEGHNDPEIVIRSNNGAHLEAQLQELESGGALVTLGRVMANLRGKINIGKGLEARPQDPQQNNGAFDQAAFPTAPAPAVVPDPSPAPAVTQPTPGWTQTPPASGAPAPQPQAAAPATAPAADPWAPAAPSDHQAWGTGPADPWATPGNPAAQQPAAAAPAGPPAGFPGAPAPTPGAPVVLGQPARMVNGSNARGPWHAWADPRPQGVTEQLSQETDDPNHPGLAAGTHRYWAWIR